MGTIEIPKGEYSELRVELATGRHLVVLIPDGLNEHEAPRVAHELAEIAGLIARLPAAQKTTIESLDVTSEGAPGPGGDTHFRLELPKKLQEVFASVILADGGGIYVSFKHVRAVTAECEGTRITRVPVVTKDFLLVGHPAEPRK